MHSRIQWNLFGVWILSGALLAVAPWLAAPTLVAQEKPTDAVSGDAAAQAADAQAADAQAADAQAADAQAADAQAADAQAKNANDTHAKSTDAQATDAQATDAQATDAQATDAQANLTMLDGIVIRQSANGLPGQKPSDDDVFQDLFLTRDRLHLRDYRTESIYILDTRGDEGTRLWILSGDGAQYRDGAELAAIQKDRDLFEEQTRKSDIDDDSLSKLHIRRDGKRVVTKERTPLEEKRGGQDLVRYVVRENGRVIVDAKVAEEFATPGPIFQFYRHVGAFSEEVLAELESIPGLPVEATITVVTASLNYEITAAIQQVSEAQIPETHFEVPEGAEKLDTGPLATCPECGESTEVDGALQGKWKGKRYSFDRQECFEAWRAARLEEVRKGKKKP